MATPNNTSKYIHKFTVYKTEEIEKTEIEKRGDEEVKLVKKVKEQVPYFFAILKPGRGLKEEGEIFHASLMAEYIKRGLITRQQLAKRYANDGGAMSDPEKKRYAELLAEILENEEKLEKSQLNLKDLSEDERRKVISEITEKLVFARSELNDIINSQNSLFEHTAETKAEEKTTFWWILNLSYMEDFAKKPKDPLAPYEPTFVPVFGGTDIKSRLASYDDYEEKKEFFWTEVIKKFSWYISMWYNGQITSEDDFNKVTESFRKMEESDAAEISNQQNKADKPEKADKKNEETVSESA